MSSDGLNQRPIQSSLRDDPDMAPVIEEFVVELSDRVTQLRNMFESGQADELRRLAHQLKGAGSGYGYEPITAAAAKLESALKAMPPELGSVRGQLEELIDLCQRARV